jgi:hypothetical protein
MGLFEPAATTPQAREAYRCAQLPGQRTLIARPAETFEKQALCHLRGTGRPFQQNKTGFDPQQLGHTPAAFGALGPGDGAAPSS